MFSSFSIRLFRRDRFPLFVSRGAMPCALRPDRLEAHGMGPRPLDPRDRATRGDCDAPQEAEMMRFSVSNAAIMSFSSTTNMVSL